MADPVCKKISQDASPLSINFGTLGFCKNYRGFHDPGMPGIDRVVQTGPNGEVQTVSVFQGDTSCGGTLPTAGAQQHPEVRPRARRACVRVVYLFLNARSFIFFKCCVRSTRLS